MAILSREDFIGGMKVLQNEYDFLDRFNCFLLQERNTNDFINGYAFRSEKIEALFLYTLKIMFDDNGDGLDLIDWWVWETDFGRHNDSWIDIDGNRIYVRDAGALYDLLIQEMENKTA